jgi:hypothetical protein
MAALLKESQRLQPATGQLLLTATGPFTFWNLFWRHD